MAAGAKGQIGGASVRARLFLRRAAPTVASATESNAAACSVRTRTTSSPMASGTWMTLGPAPAKRRHHVRRHARAGARRMDIEAISLVGACHRVKAIRVFSSCGLGIALSVAGDCDGRILDNGPGAAASSTTSAVSRTESRCASASRASSASHARDPWARRRRGAARAPRRLGVDIDAEHVTARPDARRDPKQRLATPRGQIEHAYSRAHMVCASDATIVS